MQPFDQLLTRALQDSGCQVRVHYGNPEGDNGILRVTTDDGRTYSVHFDLA